jgi:hypothetical protein
MLLSIEVVGSLIKSTWFPNKKLNLIYKASVYVSYYNCKIPNKIFNCRDGFGATDFHNKCDHKGPTLVVIRASNDYLFGGYAPIDWESCYTWKNHPDAFIFTLHNPHGIPPTRYFLKSPGDAAIFCGFCGPSFGAPDSDIFIEFDPNIRSANYINFPHSFKDTTGKAASTFTGTKNFRVSEILVYSVSNE